MSFTVMGVMGGLMMLGAIVSPAVETQLNLKNIQDQVKTAQSNYDDLEQKWKDVFKTQAELSSQIQDQINQAKDNTGVSQLENQYNNLQTEVSNATQAVQGAENTITGAIQTGITSATQGVQTATTNIVQTVTSGSGYAAFTTNIGASDCP